MRFEAQPGGKRILLLSPNLPYPTDMGANQRTFLLFKALQRLGHVDLVSVGDIQPSEATLSTLRSEFNYLGHIPREWPAFAPQTWKFKASRLNGPLQRLVHSALGWRYSLFQSPGMRRRLSRWLTDGRYDLVATRYLSTAYQTGAFDDAPALYIDFDDLESEVWQSRARDESRKAVALAYRGIAASYFKKEIELAAKCDGAWVTKASDAQRLKCHSVTVLRNIPFAAYPRGVEPLPLPCSAVILGVGVYDWLPNKQGFDWFIRKVWPLVQRQRPDSELHLVGKLSDAELKERWSATPGVRYLGRVDDLLAEYRRSLCTVAPIFSGGGTNIKVIESLAYGRNCVLTSHAAKGFEGIDGMHIADSADQFALKCLKLLENPEVTVESGLSASRAANQVFSFDAFASIVRETAAS